MREFFETTHGLPFEGVLIEWDDIVRDPDPLDELLDHVASQEINCPCPCGQMTILDCTGECNYVQSLMESSNL